MIYAIADAQYLTKMCVQPSPMSENSAQLFLRQPLEDRQRIERRSHSFVDTKRGGHEQELALLVDRRRWILFPNLAPVFGLVLPLCCYYWDFLDEDRAYTLGYICEGWKE